MMAGVRGRSAGRVGEKPAQDVFTAKGAFPMADVRIDFEDLDADALPDMCMQCAAPATTHVGKTFAYTPPWAQMLGILSLAFMKRRSVNVPMCDQHKNHWLWRGLIAGLGILGVLLLIVGGMVMLGVSSSGPTGNPSGPLMVFGVIMIVLAGVGFLAWLVTGIVLSLSQIRAIEITDYSITLKSVHYDFVRAYHEMIRGYGPPPPVDQMAREQFGRPGRGGYDTPRGRGPRGGPPDDAFERG
jgi:hypothetical protein